MTEACLAFSVRRLDHLPFRNIGPTREAEPLLKIASRCPVGLNPFCPWRYPGDFCNRRAAGAVRWRSRMSQLINVFFFFLFFFFGGGGGELSETRMCLCVKK